jgi:hypothetical protein
VATLACPGAAGAVELLSGTPLGLRWDNTLRASSAWRVEPRSGSLLPLNGDDGNRNFDRGFVSARVDLLSEADLTYRDLGVRVSAAGWYDLVYNLHNDNDSPATVNSRSVPFDHFTTATRNLHGRKLDLLDAFAFVRTQLAGMPVTARAGRHTLLWGESLLMPDNGIAYAQAPIDAIKALTLPGAQAKEVFLPVTQLSAQVQPSAKLSLAAYYQLEWRRSRLPAAGSYFSSADVLDAGGERLFPMAPPAAFFRGHDLTGHRLGQWGASGRYRLQALDVELGLYFARFHEKLPMLYLRPGVGADPTRGQIGDYLLVFQEDISLVGASFSTTIGEAAVAGEVHTRLGTPLASTAQVVPMGAEPDNDEHPLYAVGNTLHAQVSTTWPLPRVSLWGGATLLAEVGWQHRLATTKNPGARDPNRGRDAVGLRTVFTPTYYQLAPNLDFSIPLTLAFNPYGKGPLAAFNGGTHRGGVASVGLSAEYRKVWLAVLQYSIFFGRSDYQMRADRDFVALSLQRTF